MKPFAFVVMPFDPKYNFAFEVIKAAADECGIYAQRADGDVFDTSMIEHIHNQIGKADYIIALMTGLNPNVMYEVGYGVALGRRIIPIALDGEKIPFDLSQVAHVVYQRETDIGPKLRMRLEKHEEHRRAGHGTSVPEARELWIGGVRLEGDAEVQVVGEWVPGSYSGGAPGKPTMVNAASVGFRLSVHNPPKVADFGTEYLGISAPAADGFFSVNLTRPGLTATRLPDGSFLHTVPLTMDAVPDLWTEYAFTFGASAEGSGAAAVEHTGVRVVVHHYTAFGRRTYPIHIRPQGFRSSGPTFAWNRG